jgi:hypothetical protein
MNTSANGADMQRLRAETLPRGVASATTSFVATAKNAIITDTEEWETLHRGLDIMEETLSQVVAS